MSVNNTKPKLLIIGIDGGTFDLILPWVEQGKLPNLARLIREGVHGSLQSTIHPQTPAAWTTFMTGKNPGKHGVFDFFHIRDGQYDICRTNGGFRRSKTIWNIMSNSGRKVGIYNIPFTYPPEKVNGFVISGFDAYKINKKIASPVTLYQEITRELGEFPPWSPRKIFGKYYIKDFDYSVRKTTEISRYLLRKNFLDIFTVVFNAVDKVQHIFWKERSLRNGHETIDDAILYTYQKVDDAIGELIEAAGHPTVMIISDHGAGEVKKGLSLNRWLEQEGFLHYKENNARLRNNFSSVCQGFLLNGYNLFTKYLPYSAVNSIMKSPIRDILMNMIFDYAPKSQTFSSINFPDTKAFSWEPWGFGNIQINVKGIFRDGTVEPGGEYRALCDSISERLLQLKDPEDGKPVIENVYRREEIYHGEFVQKAPDLIVVPLDYAYAAGNLLGFQSKEIFPVESDMRLLKTGYFIGNHRPNGIFIVCGKKIKTGKQVRNAHIGDLAPTILHMMDVPVPSDMDGRILEEIFA